MSLAAGRELHERVLRMADRRPNPWVYWFCRHASLLLGLCYFRVQVHGKQHLRTPGAVILAPVHRSNVDVPLISAQCGRRLRSLAKEAMFRGPVSRWFSASIGAFPVRRDQLDRTALETASALLARGEPLLVFPEGTRGSGPTVGEVHHGCAYLATSTGTCVIPIGLAGTEAAMPPGAKLPRPRRIVINIGAPIEPSAAAPAGGPAAAAEGAGPAAAPGAAPSAAGPGTPTPGAPGAGSRAGREQRRALSQRLRLEMQRLLDEANELLTTRTQRH